MPATTLVCPHCEKTVEIQVSAVTRSRPCPECGEMVMLQMAEKSTKTKRRALLMNQAAAPESATPPTPRDDHEPQPLPGDAFERMRMDPEIKEFRRRLMVGTGIAILIVVVLLFLWLFHSSRSGQEQTEIKDAAAAAAASSGSTALTRPSTAMVIPEDLPPPTSAGNLVFRPAGGDLRSVALTTPPPSENLARLAQGEEVLRQFLEAPNWRERALTVRDQLRVATLMGIYYTKNSDGPVTYDSIVEPHEVPPRFSEHVVVFEGGGRRMATVEHTSSGARVDWESFVGAGDMAWSEFLDTKSTSPVLFRVLVSPAGHYANQFGNPNTLKCYSLRSIAEPGAKVVYGYMDAQNPQVKEIDYWLERNNTDAVPMTLRLKFPPQAPVDFQVWIQQFVQVGWVKQ